MRIPTLFLSSFLVFYTFNSVAQISSTFDTDDEGWTVVQNVVTTPTYDVSAGNPGGSIAITDQNPIAAAAQWWYWQAPVKFLGDVGTAYGSFLRFDLQQSTSGTDLTESIVRISDGSLTLYYFETTAPALSPFWTSYAIPLDENSGWKTANSTTATDATKAEIKQVLSAVSSLMIRGEFSGPLGALDVGGLDNVILETLPIIPSPVITSFTPESGIPLTTNVTINGSGFGANVAANAVYFGSTRATILTANPTRLIVTVPAGGKLGPITVVNLTTGLIGQSLKPFNPTFADGGRIIPASIENPSTSITLSTLNGNTATDLNLADIDGDGWVDVLLSESEEGISIFRNLGTGGSISSASFAPKITLPLALVTGQIRIADIDGDGKQDIAAISVATVIFYQNISTPGSLAPADFEPDSVVAPSTDMRDIQLADIDGDGRIDLLLTLTGGCSGQPTFVIWQGMSTPGDIEFLPYKNYDGGFFCYADEITVADFNNDGKQDVAVVNNFETQFHIFENNSVPGTISFTTPVLIDNVIAIRGSVNVADFDVDNKPDLAWRSDGTNDIRIRLNTNTGGAISSIDFDFSTEIILQSSLAGTVGELSLADINGDGKPDLIATDDTDVAIFENVYSGAPLTVNSFVYYEYEGGTFFSLPSFTEAADLNGDHKPDLVFAMRSGAPRSLVFFENINAHTPEISLTTVSPLKGPVGSTVTITGDYFSTTPSENIVQFGAARATVLTATRNMLTVTVPRGATHAPVSVTCNELTAQYHLPFNVTFSNSTVINASSFGPPVNFTLTSAGSDIDVADLNDDNKPDIVADGLFNYTYVFRNTQVGTTITTAALFPDDTVTVGQPHLADLNGDAKPEVFGVSSIVRNNHITGDEISFAAPVIIGSNPLTGFADFNLDGRTDLAGLNGANASVHQNQTRSGLFVSGAFPSMSSSSNFPKPSAGGHTVAADFDNDGFKDIASTNNATDDFTVWRSSGALRMSPSFFTLEATIPTGDFPRRIYAGDIDVDGKMDLVLYHDSTGTSSTVLSVFRNTTVGGVITFARHDFTLGGEGGPSAIADLDGDGRPEIIVTHERSNAFTILKNISAPTAITASSFIQVLFSLPAPRSVAAGDINRDGKPDLLFNSAPNTLSVLQNLISGAVISFDTQPSSSTVCAGTTTDFSVAASGDNNLVYQWQVDDGGGFTDLSDNSTYSGVNTAILTITNPDGSLDGNIYRVLVNGDVTIGTPSASATLTIIAVPAQPSAADVIGCVSDAIVLTATGGSDGNYRWYDVVSGGVALPGEVNASFTTPALTTTTSYFVAITNGTCESARAEVIVNINNLPSAPVTTDESRCAPGSVTLTASGGSPGNYRWYDVETGGAPIPGEINASFTTPSITSTTTYYVSLNDGICEGERAPAIATINTLPAIPAITSSLPIVANVISVCNENLILSAPEGFSDYLWSNGEQTREITIASGNADQYSVEVTDANGCTSPSSNQLTVVSGCSSNPPVIVTETIATQIEGKVTTSLLGFISDEDDDLDLSTLRVVTQPTSGAEATIDNNYNLVLDYNGISFSGIENIIIEVCDQTGSCTQEEITIEVVGEIEVFNAVSPNGDNLNDFLRLKYIEIIESTRSNRVTIFNRWGDVVFEMQNYDNASRVFRGLNDKGNELPSGTYFYRIDFSGNRKSQTGYLSLKR